MTGSLSDRDLVRNVLTEFGVETVYHLAWSSIHETATRHPVADIEANLLPTVQLLDACREAGVRRVVYVSSGGTVYGTPCAGTIAEDHPTQPINAYGVTKLTVEKYLGGLPPPLRSGICHLPSFGAMGRVRTHSVGREP